jgi:hemoglobin-like flavoprotein
VGQGSLSLDVERLEASLHAVSGRGAELADTFYAGLFARQPALRELFPEELGPQKRKLIASLGIIVGALRQPERLRAYLLSLGAEHGRYGVRAEHYPLVGQTLLAALREVAGGELWDDLLERAWSEAYAAVQVLMLEGAAARLQGES